MAPANPEEESKLQIRVDGETIHGDWTLLASFREIAKKDLFLVQITYPRTLTWSMEEYGRAVNEAVLNLGIRDAWVLAESYSSQVAWAWLQIARDPQSLLSIRGIILAGGFVRYPFPVLLRLAGLFVDVAPWQLWKLLFWIYVRYSGFRYRNAPGSANSAKEFVDRRNPLDIAAIRHRLRLIADYDPRAIATSAHCPIFLLAGFIDPVVVTLPVLRWLRSRCSAFKAHLIIWPADHNVLGTEPAKSAEQIAKWILPA